MLRFLCQVLSRSDLVVGPGKVGYERQVWLFRLASAKLIVMEYLSYSCRSYVMRYYGYSDKNKSRCLNVIFFLSAGLHSARFIVFSYRNTTTFNSVYDTPLFFIFLFKGMYLHWYIGLPAEHAR